MASSSMASFCMDIDIRIDNLSFFRFNPNFPYHPGHAVFRSEDGILFALDVERLWIATGFKAFDTSSSLIPGVADVPYPSHILERLFLCLFPIPFPSFKEMEFEELILFGKAANHFCICSATALNLAYLRNYIDQFPKDILAFAVDCGYDFLIDEIAATDFLKAPLSEVAGLLPDPLFRLWCLQRDAVMNDSTSYLTH
ncbi:hypothetical protein F5878DRAFT_672268 [Lentinula raphanica]|uniref:Uncharacterized protein n=1 Tax=Lentinula raphanica TaxID=153919 RepID=A0AA38PE70_9AGAR|nr:hypothetical protein F5878DRAFT_672268 [Lentinula raphanica]